MLSFSLLRLLRVLALGLLAGPVQAGELLVSAASSLTNAFKDIALGYEALHPGTKVQLNFGASGALLQQIVRGAPVDVLASADQETLDAAQSQGLVVAGDRKDFVRNTLVVVAPLQTPVPVRLDRLEDLAQPAIARVALAHPASVPVGRYAQRALESARLWPAVQAKAVGTQNVRQSLDYVARGEVEAGFVYATDAALMKDKVRVALVVPLELPILYPVARTVGSRQPAEAAAFIQYLGTPAAQAIFARYGFAKP
ncbi:MAG: molybdate ABC transporter substrate-binding protein [Burkholderiaceae bacterium]|nr:molybdate ABC transporter substrate-binding protein [Burkholderiaceae bacterium]